jgi:hypothetical protein
MNARLIAGIASFCMVLTGLFLANFFLMMMIGEINRKRPEERLISYFGFAPPKMVQIFGEYRRCYPAGKLHVYSLAAYAIALFGLVGVAVCLRIIG